MRKACLALVAALCAPAAWAHDFWLQPRSFWIPEKGAALVSIQVGHGADRETWSVDPGRVLMYRSIGPGGAVIDRRAQVRPGSAPQALNFSTPGTHVVVLQTNHAESSLPAVRFNDFLKEEGLTPALRHRERTRTTGRPGREIYSRRVKTLIQVGPAGGRPQPHVTRPVGLTLEIVPERNPYTAPAGAPLPVRVLYEGRPVAGALVKLTNLQADAKPAAQALTDRAGRATFTFPRRGAWLLNVVWTKPLKGHPKADFDTTFSSLAFGFPEGGAATGPGPQRAR
jgi:hypothetical protein